MNDTGQITLGSLFDGIGGWLFAALHAGIRPAWSSEIEAFPCAVTKRHFPEVKQLGDITKLNGAEVPPVDIVCAGSPCQDLSIAGSRKGLDGARSGLFRVAVKLIRDMRRATCGQYPRFFVWENVPGAFSSNKGLDFRAVLEEVAESEIPMPRSCRWADAGMVRSHVCEAAWRVLDAQYWGVPQRRKRIFLVADFAAHDRCAAEILFECEGVQGNFAPGRQPGKGTAAGTKSRAGKADTGITAAGFKGGQGGKAGGIGYALEKAATLSAKHCGVEPTVLVYENHGQDSRIKGSFDKCPSINAQAGTGGNNLPLVLYATINEELQPSLVAKGAGAVMTHKIVRRLMPLECERLQGLPDGYTQIEGKRCLDAARYKALGNGMAQPCADFVIKRIVEAMKL